MPQIYESKLLGADAVLLICALLITILLTGILKSAMSLGFLPLWKPIPKKKSLPPLRLVQD